MKQWATTKKSSEILNNLLHDAEQRNELEALMILHRQLFNLYSKINDKEAARYHHLAYFTTKEEIAGMGNQGLTINEIELKQSIQDYQKSLLAASIKEQHDKVVIICISIAAVCAVLALILTIYFSRKQRHYIMELYKRNQPSNTEFKKNTPLPVSTRRLQYQNPLLLQKREILNPTSPLLQSNLPRQTQN